jgi:branched-chain amino acid transport system substrate-binding protein
MTNQILTMMMMICLLLLTACGSNIGNVVIEEPLKIGAILPLSGPGAIYGEQVMNGMELANRDFEIIYEDSQASPAKGVTAYTKLRDIDDVDVIFSIFSSVSIPLIQLADQDKMPLILTFVSAKDAASTSKYSFRLFPSSEQYVTAQLLNLQKLGITEIAVLYKDDAFGQSQFESIVQHADNYSVSIVLSDKFEIGSYDYKTQLIKAENSGAEALVFVGQINPETINVVKQIEELNINMEFFEVAPILAMNDVQQELGSLAEGKYTTVYPFIIGENDFKRRHAGNYDPDSFYAVGFGYDILTLIQQATVGAKVTGDELVSRIHSLGVVDTTNGPLVIGSSGEINPPVYSVQIVDGKLVRPLLSSKVD